MTHWPANDFDFWKGKLTNAADKQKPADEMAAMAKSGEVIGAGSGSTAYLTICALARRVRKERLDCAFIPTSHEVALTCQKEGLKIVTLNQHQPDWCFDGADEIDPDRNMIKGRGGAMFREKLVFAAAKRRFILADPSKKVARLGEKFPVPVEVHPEALLCVTNTLKAIDDARTELRMAGSGKDGPVITENGNLIVDLHLPNIQPDSETRLKAIPGVIETGLFIGYAPEIVIAGA